MWGEPRSSSPSSKSLMLMLGAIPAASRASSADNNATIDTLSSEVDRP